MRAWQIAKILILIQLCVGVVNGILVLYDLDSVASPHPYYTTINDSNTQFVIGDLDDLNQTTDEGFTGMNSFDLGISMVTSGWMLVWSILGSMVSIFPLLVDTFHCPPLLAGIFQTGIYLEVLYGVAQWRSGRSGYAIEA